MSGPTSGGKPGPRGDAALWLQRHGAALRRYFRRRVGPADVDDLVQEVLLKLQAASIDSDMSGAERYLFTVARNVMIDRHRLEQTHDRGSYEAYIRIAGCDDHMSPERILLAREEYARVRKAIVNLPPRPRTAFVLHRLENMTYTEIAEVMSISRETVKDLVRRALNRVVLESLCSDTPND